MKNIIVIIVILIIVGLALTYIIREKKKGVKCIGCPSGGSCSSKHCGCCDCSNESK